MKHKTIEEIEAERETERHCELIKKTKEEKNLKGGVNNMGKPILKTDMPREEGYLYYVKGNPLVVYKSKMSRGGKKKKKSKK